MPNIVAVPALGIRWMEHDTRVTGPLMIYPEPAADGWTKLTIELADGQRLTCVELFDCPDEAMDEARRIMACGWIGAYDWTE